MIVTCNPTFEVFGSHLVGCCKSQMTNFLGADAVPRTKRKGL